MKLLLDTHYALWLTTRPDLLKPGELAFLLNSAVDTAISAVSVWELRLKWNSFRVSGERKGPIDPNTFQHVAEDGGATFIELTAAQAAAPLDPPLAHKDPFDELLLVQAQQTGRRLLTRDRLLLRHPLALAAPA